MLTLTSMASKAVGLHEYMLDKKSDDAMLVNKTFAQGDVVKTIIKCARGEIISLTLDTTLPRYYSRDFSVHGTKGMYDEASESLFLAEEHSKFHESWPKNGAGNAPQYEEKYDHPLWKKFVTDGVRGTHGGMDLLMFEDFFERAENNKPMPIDVYDIATWMIISHLTEMSIAKGGMPVDFPDFTNGKWLADRDRK